MKPIIAALFATNIAILAFALAPQPGEAQRLAPDAEPVLIELFTSQGCSSCPPADRLAQKLDREPGYVVISRPVTYWDRLGWTDTLASEANTQLQYDYASRGLDGYNGVYTPQSVVAGRHGEVGSKERAVRKLAAQASGQSGAAIRVRGDGERGYGIGIAGTSSREAELVLIGVDAHAEVAIGRGENRGRRIAYTNVVCGERRIATWDGGKGSHVIRPEQLTMPGADRYALVLREPNAGAVHAARWLD